MTLCVYTYRGINVRHHRGAESPGYFESPRFVGVFRRRARAAAAPAADLGLEAPQGAARRLLRRSTRRSATARLSLSPRATDGRRRLARAVPAILDGACRYTRTSPRPDGTRSKERKEPMSNPEKYVPSPLMNAKVQKDDELWTLIVVHELRQPPAMVWEALTDPAQLAQWAPFDADR